MNNQVLRSVRAHPVEVWGKIRALVLELVAHRAILREQFRAVRGVAGLDDFGPQLRDECILLLLFRTFEVGDDFRGVRSHGGIRVRTQAMQVPWPKHGGIKFAISQRPNHCAGPIRALQQLSEHCFTQVEIKFGQCGEQRLSRSGVVRGTERFNRATLQTVARIASHERGNQGNNTRVKRAHAEKIGRRLPAFLV